MAPFRFSERDMHGSIFSFDIIAAELTDEVLQKMYNDSVLIPAVLYLLMFVVLLFVYPLGKQKIAELQAEKEALLQKLHEGA